MPNAVLAGSTVATTKRDALCGKRTPRIALLSPYNGGNLGDAAIQDALIANLRLRVPEAEFCGICLNCDNFQERHGTGAFPLCVTDRPFYRMFRGRLTEDSSNVPFGEIAAIQKADGASTVKTILRRVPGLARCWRTFRRWGSVLPRELGHCVTGYRFMRAHDLVIISGGGQLEDEWGGAWAHPFALLKWAVLARLAGIPYAVVSVGAGRLGSKLSRVFVAGALRLARYRSYRDRNSREIVSQVLKPANKDAIVPDLAFSIPASTLPPAAALRLKPRNRPIIAISPIVYGKAGNWPTEHRVLHERYMRQMAQIISQLLRRDYLIIMVSSSLGDDDKVIGELVSILDNDCKSRISGQIQFPAIHSWRDLAGVLRASDYLIASRLHSIILGYVSDTLSVAISFDPKVDWLMADVGQADYLLNINDFFAQDVVDRLDCLMSHKPEVIEHIRSHRTRLAPGFAAQYDSLAALALAHPSFS